MSIEGVLDVEEDFEEVSPAVPVFPEWVLDEKVIREVLWFYSAHGGLEPGGFRTKLIEAFVLADPENFAALSTAFPAIGYWVAMLKRHPYGVMFAHRALELLGVES